MCVCVCFLIQKIKILILNLFCVQYTHVREIFVLNVVRSTYSVLGTVYLVHLSDVLLFFYRIKFIHLILEIYIDFKLELPV